ncbi:MAG TPA: hypothetical protein VMR77_04300 [Patescibacteria group bacterium]|nr:hypothetical protein [Patescibacteria group bacterium]
MESKPEVTRTSGSMISFQPSGTLLNETVPPHFTTGGAGGVGVPQERPAAVTGYGFTTGPITTLL